MTTLDQLDRDIAQSEAQLEIYEIELRSSTEGSGYYEAVMSLYVDELQRYGGLRLSQRSVSAASRAAWLDHPASARFW